MFRDWRSLSGFMTTMLVVWLSMSPSTRADSSEADLVAQLQMKIDAQQSEVQLLREGLAKAISTMTSGLPRESVSPLKPAPSIEITDIETWWDSDGRLPYGLAPTFRFRLRNAGTKPITNLDLSCTYYLASGTKFGSGSNSVVPNVVQILAPGQWMKVQFDWREYSRENGGESPSLRPMTVQAEIVLSTDQNTHDIVRRITIPPKPHRLPIEASSR